MKVKQHPNDFQVEELTNVPFHSSGTFALYLLTKKNVGTPEAVQQLCQGLRVVPQRVSFGGLKDTHAVTSQHVTIQHGPKRNWRSASLELSYLGQVVEPFHSKHIAANRFTINLRQLETPLMATALQTLPDLAVTGVGNYFDDQRFGSVTPDGQFVARRLIADDHEGALKIALCAPYPHDNSAEKRTKQLLRDFWGNWPHLRTRLSRGTPQRVAAFLAQRPADFRGALLQLPHTLLTLYLSAYQSYLWNQMLAEWFCRSFPRERLVHVQQKAKSVPMLARLEPDERERLLATRLPLPSARLKLEVDSPWLAVVESVMAAEGITLSMIKLKHLREVFFSKGEREVWYLPQEMSWQVQPAKQPGRQDLLLRFTLPRGCYATMILKRIAAASTRGKLDQDGSSSISSRSRIG